MGFKYSFIIPAYNAEKYIEQCLESIFAQKYGNIEIIVVNDGSSDNTKSIVENICERHQQVLLINKTNGGQLSARLKGVEIATGDFICFLDSDDMISDFYIEKINTFLESNPVDVLSFNWNIVDENGNQIKKRIPPVFKSSGIVEKEKYIDKIITTTQLNSLWSKVFKKDLFSNCVYKDVDFLSRHGEDLVQTLKLIQNAESFAYINEPLYLYRLNQSSVSNTFNRKSHVSLQSTRPALLDFLIENHLDTEQNIKKYYRMYFAVILQQLYLIGANLDTPEDIKKEYSEIFNYETVSCARNYLYCAGVLKRHLMMKFYARKFDYLIRVFKLIKRIKS